MGWFLEKPLKQIEVLSIKKFLDYLEILVRRIGNLKIVLTMHMKLALEYLKLDSDSFGIFGDLDILVVRSLKLFQLASRNVKCIMVLFASTCYNSCSNMPVQNMIF